MALSIIVKKEALAKVLPPEKLARDKITIKTNTYPAAIGVLPPGSELPPDCIFPPAPPPEPVNGRLPPEPPKLTTDEYIDIIIEKYKARGRSESVRRIREMPKKPVNIGDTTIRSCQVAADWKITDKIPFSRHPGFSDEEWWQDDLDVRARMVSTWHKKHWLASYGSSGNHYLTDEEPSERNQSSEYPIMAPLCGTYVPDRDYLWHANHIAPLELQETIELARHAEHQLRDFERDAAKFEMVFRNIEGMSRYMPQDERLRRDFQNARHNRQRILMEVCKTEETVKILNERVKDLMRAGQPDTDGPGIPIGENREKSMARLAERQRKMAEPEVPIKPGGPTMPIPIPGAKRSFRMHEEDGVPTPSAKREPFKQEAAGRDVLSTMRKVNQPAAKAKRTTEPFPAYIDPMTTREEDTDSGPPESLMVMKQMQDTPVLQRGRTRGKSLRELIEGTGVARERKVRFDLPAKKNGRPEPKMPATPTGPCDVLTVDEQKAAAAKAKSTAGGETKKELTASEPVIVVHHSGAALAA